MGYRGAGLPFHSSWQGLSRARRDPRRQPGPSCLPCTCPGSGCAARPRGASSRRIGGVSPEQEGSKGQRGLGGQEHREWGKVRACQGSCQAPADPALAAALRPLPHARNRSPGACGAFLPRALTNSSLWVPALAKITDFITSPENGHCPPPQSSVCLLAQPWLWAGLGWRSHWL